MADNKKIKVDALDFNEIKTNFKTFLSGQSQFKDYNFDGSGLSVLIDLMSYNTHYNALYTNFAINEMFLDSASKRESVVSIAKMLGYVPKSITASQATVNIRVSGISDGTSQVIIPAYSQFTTAKDGVSYTFLNQDDLIQNYNGSDVIFNNIHIIEGTLQTQNYVVSTTTTYTISNINCDTSTIKVYVNQNVSTSAAVKFNLCDDITTVNGNTPIYFLKEIENGLYEVYFGDGVIGKALDIGNYVTITYLTTSGDNANACSVFKLNLMNVNYSVQTRQKSFGGMPLEGIESIKFNAPRAYSMQNRAVTEGDYKNLILREYPNIRSINVWGGEENDPPVYGKVFISIKPETGDYIDASVEKYIVERIIKPKSVVTTIPQYVKPDYITVELAINVYYNPKVTALGADTLKSKVLATITNYNNTELTKFNDIIRYSKFCAMIDAIDESFQNNITNIIIRYELEPKYNTNSAYYCNIGNPIYSSGVAEYAVNTTGFYIQSSSDIYYIKDDGNGILVAYYKANNLDIIIDNNVGSVDYTKGIINITNLYIVSLASPKFELIIKPQSNDVVSMRNQIIKIDTDLLTVNMYDSPAGSSYIFSSSRT